MPFILEDLSVYQLSETLGDSVWKIVEEWNSFEKYSLGKQLVSSVDSISANIAEGYGRFSVKENIHFCFYARGSLLETKTWVGKAYRRGLISDSLYQSLYHDMESIHKKLNGYIKVLKQNSVQ